MKESAKLKAKKLKLKTSRIRTLFPTFILSISHHKRIWKEAGKYTFYIVICLFLFFNISLSQHISPLYFQMMNGEQKAFVYYLQSIPIRSGSIRNLPQFSSEFLRLKNVYGKGLENDVYRKEIQEKRLIQNYEQILIKNPYARDVLYSLYLLYKQKDDKIMAEEYFQKAKAIDPMLK